MSFWAQSALVAAVFAAMCVFGNVVGCLLVLAIGLIALAAAPREGSADAARSPKPQFSQFVPWGICIVFYAVFVLLLSPFASLPAVVMALLVLSPLFGTLVFLTTSAINGLTRRGR